jgi:hypothetical protein
MVGETDYDEWEIYLQDIRENARRAEYAEIELDAMMVAAQEEGSLPFGIVYRASLEGRREARLEENMKPSEGKK